MNKPTQELLSELAKWAGLQIEFPEAAPIRISGFHDGQDHSINRQQPDSELIYSVLQAVGRVAIRDNPAASHIPWYLNKPYQNERIGEIAYITRRTLRRIFSHASVADFWAMHVYAMIGTRTQLTDLLRRHPENWRFVPLVWYGIQKTPTPGKPLINLKFLWAMFAAACLPAKQPRLK